LLYLLTILTHLDIDWITFWRIKKPVLYLTILLGV